MKNKWTETTKYCVYEMTLYLRKIYQKNIIKKDHFHLNEHKTKSKDKPRWDYKHQHVNMLTVKLTVFGQMNIFEPMMALLTRLKKQTLIVLYYL